MCTAHRGVMSDGRDAEIEQVYASVRRCVQGM